METNTDVAFVTQERGEVESHLHFQGMVVVTTTSPTLFKNQLVRHLYPSGPPANLSISLKKLTNKGLHTQDGIIGYAMKDHQCDHYHEIVCHNVTDAMKQQGKMQYLLHGKICVSKNRIALNQNNIITKMQMYLKYQCANITSYSRDPLGLLLCMMRSGHYSLEMQWIKDRNGLSLHRLKTLWKCNLFPEEIEKKDLLAVMFPHDANFAHDALGRRGLFDTDFDGFSRADFTRYHNYPELLHQEGMGRRGQTPGNLVSDGVDIEHDDFMALSNITSELGPRLDMIHRTMDHVFQGRTFASLDPFSSERDFVPLVQTTD